MCRVIKRILDIFLNTFEIVLYSILKGCWKRQDLYNINKQNTEVVRGKSHPVLWLETGVEENELASIKNAKVSYSITHKIEKIEKGFVLNNVNEQKSNKQ